MSGHEDILPIHVVASVSYLMSGHEDVLPIHVVASVSYVRVFTLINQVLRGICGLFYLSYGLP
jgi:hypothetical protein